MCLFQSSQLTSFFGELTGQNRALAHDYNLAMTRVKSVFFKSWQQDMLDRTIN